jgi:hypothetical protein
MLTNSISAKTAKQLLLLPMRTSQANSIKNNRDLGFVLNSARSTSDAYSLDIEAVKTERWTFSEAGGLNTSTFAETQLGGGLLTAKLSPDCSAVPIPANFSASVR